MNLFFHCSIQQKLTYALVFYMLIVILYVFVLISEYYGLIFLTD